MDNKTILVEALRDWPSHLLPPDCLTFDTPHTAWLISPMFKRHIHLASPVTAESVRMAQQKMRREGALIDLTPTRKT